MRQEIVKAAESWIGTPYHHYAQIKGSGCDCLQLLVAVFTECKLIPEKEWPHYAYDWHMHNSEELYLDGLMKYAKKTDDPQPGDVAMFKFGRTVSHAAIVISWPMMIHAYNGHGVVYVSAHDAELRGRLHSFWTMVQ
jgi:NlpC/P60 family putative phage cell wall peptidase